MKAMIVISIILSLFANNNYKIDFGKTTGGQNWMIVNDDVMGGLSNSTAELTDSTLIFKGTLSLKNNGGFASIRSKMSSLDLSGFTTVKIKFKSSGRNFDLNLATSELYYKPNYKHQFGSTTGVWEIVTLELSDFKQYTMGRVSGPNIGKKDLENILRIGIMLSDKKEGPFEIEIDYIEFE